MKPLSHVIGGTLSTADTWCAPGGHGHFISKLLVSMIWRPQLSGHPSSLSRWWLDNLYHCHHSCGEADKPWGFGATSVLKMFIFVWRLTSHMKSTTWSLHIEKMSSESLNQLHCQTSRYPVGRQVLDFMWKIYHWSTKCTTVSCQWQQGNSFALITVEQASNELF